MKTLQVELGDRRYPIHIGSGLLARRDLVVPYFEGRRVAIVTNDTVARLYLATARLLAGSETAVEIVLPDGEQYKTLDVAAGIFDKLIEARCDRRTMIVALGGGVVGDMAGFAAACYQRGVPFIQLPTTLLAQVDSSVGGKTGVNHRLGKNMIGAFYQPQAVIIDTDTLQTLSERELRAGMAEVIKYGAIGDADFFAWLEANLPRVLAREPNALAYAIERSCRNKADIVVRDERESGPRAILNFGHTFGHAIETATRYETWLHGEAIAAGMVMAADLSRRLGWLSEKEVQRITALIRSAGLPDRAPVGIGAQQLLNLMGSDKKVEHGALRLILLKRLGQAEITADVPAPLIADTLMAHVSPA